MPILQVINENGPGVPVKIWSDTVESQAMDQLKNTARLPFVFHHVAAMADTHLGMGATIGSVIATKGAIVPAAVGVDIGCGMVAQKTKLRVDAFGDKSLAELRHSIERGIPVGFGRRQGALEEAKRFIYTNPTDNIHILDKSNPADLLSRASCQLGTLGGGNHFIEICHDEDGWVWAMLHSGSRNIGKVLAEVHIKKAKGLMKEMFISLPDPNLAYLAEGSEAFDAYMNDLLWAQAYAYKNRELMMDIVMHQLLFTEPAKKHNVANGGIFDGLPINCHHNYVERENHFGQNVLVTRKGAIRARVGDMGIIPGSMGTGSYIVEGLGNHESFTSAPHGAGRRMSRTQAKKLYTVEDVEKQTAGVECRKDSGVIDEIPSAYKKIETVIQQSSDLVRVVAKLKQVLCIKG
jgi:tRNA-splicing ligase RtcB